MNRFNRFVLLPFGALALIFLSVAAISPTTPLRNAFLQSDFNGNSKSITNVNSIKAAIFIGDGSGLTNLSSGSSSPWTNSFDWLYPSFQQTNNNATISVFLGTNIDSYANDAPMILVGKNSWQQWNTGQMGIRIAHYRDPDNFEGGPDVVVQGDTHDLAIDLGGTGQYSDYNLYAMDETGTFASGLSIRSGTQNPGGTQTEDKFSLQLDPGNSGPFLNGLPGATQMQLKSGSLGLLFNFGPTGGFYFRENGTNGGTVTAIGGFVSSKNNKSAPASISVTSSVFNYTNTQTVNIQVFLDANGATTAVSFNGTTIFGSLVGGDHSIIMQPGDRVGITYSVATPVMRYREF